MIHIKKYESEKHYSMKNKHVIHNLINIKLWTTSVLHDIVDSNALITLAFYFNFYMIIIYNIKEMRDKIYIFQKIIVEYKILLTWEQYKMFSHSYCQSGNNQVITN